MSFGEKMKERRLELKISQSKLAKRDEQNSYRRMLVKTAINYRIRQEAEALAEGLGIAVEEVLRIWEEENKNSVLEKLGATEIKVKAT